MFSDLHSVLHRHDDVVRFVVSTLLATLFSCPYESIQVLISSINFPLLLLNIALTLETISIQEVLAFLVSLHAALCAPHPLPSETPEQPLALEAICGRRGRPYDEVVRRGTGNRVDERLQCLLVNVHLLQFERRSFLENDIRVLFKRTSNANQFFIV